MGDDELWRVIDQNNQTHEATVRRVRLDFDERREVVIAGKAERFNVGIPVSACVAWAAAMQGIPVFEVLPPGKRSRDEVMREARETYGYGAVDFMTTSERIEPGDAVATDAQGYVRPVSRVTP